MRRSKREKEQAEAASLSHASSAGYSVALTGESEEVVIRSRPTMTDVARTAGVSQSSVSLVLNQMMGARIADATRERVMTAARELGYELPGSRRLVRTVTERNVIAYLVDEISTSPHPVVSLDGARDAGWVQHRHW